MPLTNDPQQKYDKYSHDTIQAYLSLMTLKQTPLTICLGYLMHILTKYDLINSTKRFGM